MRELLNNALAFSGKTGVVAMRASNILPLIAAEFDLIASAAAARAATVIPNCAKHDRPARAQRSWL